MDADRTRLNEPAKPHSRNSGFPEARPIFTRSVNVYFLSMSWTSHSGWITQNSPLGYASCEAAYTSGEPWRQALLTHLRGNRAALYAFLEERLPELRIDPMEATYLAWVDVRELG